MQYALSLHDYDITRHQPHPPGYPGYIALAWLAKTFTPGDNDALLVVGVASAAITVVAIHRIALTVIDRKTALIAGVLAVINPLMWFYSSIALAYMVGTALATCAVWAAVSARGKSRWLIPVLNGLASVVWLPAGVLVAPVCIYGFLTIAKPTRLPDLQPQHGPLIEIFAYAALAAGVVLAGYLPVISDTGGFAAYMAEISSESGKHMLRFGEWASHPVDEFLATTGSLAVFFKDGLGMSCWLLLMLLVPVMQEKGTDPKRVTAMLPLLIAGLAAFMWGSGILRMTGIFVFFSLAWFLLPTPGDILSVIRRKLFIWWLVPGLLLFVLVYVNLVGIFIIFLPPLILLAAWSIIRAADFMGMQTVQDFEPSEGEESEATIEEKLKAREIAKSGGRDARVWKFIVIVLLILTFMNDLGGLAENKSGENILELKLRDAVIEDVLKAVSSAPAAESRLMILCGPGELGSPGHYRHMQYYFPEAKSIWTKYILYDEVRENRLIWRSDRDEKSLPDEIFDTPLTGLEHIVPAASFNLDGIDGIIAFEKDLEIYGGPEHFLPLFADPLVTGREPECYYLDVSHASGVVFIGAKYVDWIAPNDEYIGAWVSDWGPVWWIE